MSDKPPFNPNAAFQAVDNKPPFDPSQPHEVVDQATSAPADNGNWKKLAQLGGMATPGSEWAMPDDETVNDPIVRSAMKSQAQAGLGIGLGGAAGEVAALGGAGATGVKAALTRAGTQGAINAAVNPEHPGESFASGAALTGALDAMPAAAGWGAKKLIQKATGIREPSSQVGQELLDQGLWGTQGMMQRQARKGIEQHSDELGRVVSGIPGKADVSPIANDLQQRAQDLKINGLTPPTDVGLSKKYDELAQFLGAKPEMSYPDLRKFKSGQGQAGYKATSGVIKDTDTGISSSAAERGASKMLSEAYGKANPNMPNLVDTQNSRISALYDASNGLNRSTSLSSMGKTGAAAAAAYAIGGAPLAAAVAAGKTSIGQSSLAQLIRGVGKGAEKTSPEMLRMLGVYGSDGVKEPK